MKCWCGETVTDDSFAADLEPTCGGGGWLHCSCGGDSCVCHWHGGTDCDGCADCDEGDDHDDGDADDGS